ncbi:MAG: GNAT family N-acetyltransferase [Christensenellaceae bacterium]|nr:GNAT family N-acetyltransferase [Christensenellaceae bacterium]
MLVAEKQCTLKNGKSAILRPIYPNEAETFLSAYIQTSSETSFISNYPEEINITVEQEKALLERFNENPNMFFIGAYVDDTFAGSISLMKKTNIKEKHKATFGIAVLQKYWGMGIGKALMIYAMEQAKAMGVKLLDLRVLSGNAKAIKLYEDLGFIKAGEIPGAFILKDGAEHSDIIMYKRL